MKITIYFKSYGRFFEHTIPQAHVDRAICNWRKYADTLIALAKRKIGDDAMFTRVVKNDSTYRIAYSNKDLYNVPKILNSL